MKRNPSLLILMLAGALLINACGSSNPAMAFSSAMVLTGSTPGGEAVNGMFSIAPEKPVDFVRWKLALESAGRESRSFNLDLLFGVSEPNTPGFKGGGESLSFTGTYTVSKSRDHEVLRLTGDKIKGPIVLLKISGSTFHLLAADETLMVGTGGWSYTLNRQAAGETPKAKSSSWARSFKDERAAETIFVGRTPCAEIATEYKWTLERECPKLKWKLTLSRDVKTGQPSEYAIQRTLERANILTGKWMIAERDGALIVTLDPDLPEKRISLLVGDDNVLFLDKSGQLYPGNNDFSYVLNRQVKQAA